MKAASILITLAAILAFRPATACAQAADDSLIGLWASDVVETSSLHGTLTVTGAGGVWSATLAGRQAQAATGGADIRLNFGAEQGAFRGRLAQGRRSIEGFWIQPGQAGDQNFASPLVLRSAGDGRWRGVVTPLPHTFTLYLKIFRDTDGALLAAFRNPDRNSNGGRTQFLVTRAGDAVTFTSRPAPGQATVEHRATLSAGGLRMDWPDIGGALDLKQRTPAQATAFYPRPPGSPPYVYQRPPRLADGWRTASAASVGIDEAALAKVVQAQIDSDPSARRPSLMHSILVARHGKLVLEAYFFGFDRRAPHDIRSAGKTYASVMLGSAMRTDPALTPTASAYALLRPLGPFANPDPRKARITLDQLMTHTAGLACDGNDDTSLGAEDTMQAQTRQPNWWKYTLDLPMAHEPGQRYAYCSANTNLIGAVLVTRTHTWLPELFDRTVARPLQFGPYYWNLMANGEGYLGGGAYLTPRDFMKLGQAYLSGGIWNGHRIVSADWVRQSTAQHAVITPAATGLDPVAFANFYSEATDGYDWHLNQLTSGGRAYREYEANGNGGQLLIVVPELDLVVVFTAGNYGQGGIWSRWRDLIVAQQIIPAIRA